MMETRSSSETFAPLV